MSDFFGDHPQLLKVHQAVHFGVVSLGREREYQLLTRYAEVTKHMKISGAAINTYADNEPDVGRCLPGAN